MKNIIKNTSKGFTLIELVMVTIILGILAAVAIPRYQETVDNAEASAEKAFADMIWAGLEEHASETLMETGNEAWPYNPLEVINRSRNVQITMFEGVPDEDGEWQFSVDAVGEPALFHQRRNDEVWYYTYDSLSFELSKHHFYIQMSNLENKIELPHHAIIVVVGFILFQPKVVYEDSKPTLENFYEFPHSLVR